MTNSKLNIKNYFNTQAPRYDNMMDSYPWSLLKKYELSKVQTLVPNLKNLNCLDICCGTGSYSLLMRDAGAENCVGIDLSEEMIRLYRTKGFLGHNVKFESFFSDTKFDFAICAGGLEFISSLKTFWEKLDSITNPGSKIVLLYPPKSFLGHVYKFFHQRNGINIELYREASDISGGNSWQICRELKIHPYAHVALYEKQ